MAGVFLSLGSNLGDRANYLRKAVKLIVSSVGQISELSSVYESEPWGFKSFQNFYNQVVLIDTALTPEEVLVQIEEIEKKLGRSRTKGIIYAPRTMDIDILFYDSEIIDEDHLKIPHPFLHLRKFVLMPLNEIAPGFVHPKLDLTVSHIIKMCEDELWVKVLDD